MVLDKDYLVSSITDEIEDRTDEIEVKDLKELRNKVLMDSDLNYDEYEWLSYLVGNKRESELRDELE